MDIKISDFDGKYHKLLENIEDKKLKTELEQVNRENIVRPWLSHAACQYSYNFYFFQEKHKNVLKNLAKCLINPKLTEITAGLFPEIVVLLFQEVFTGQESDANKYKWKVIALAKLIDSHSMLKR